MKWFFNKKKKDVTPTLDEVFRLENTFNVHRRLIGLDKLVNAIAISTATIKKKAGRKPTKDEAETILFNESVLTYLNSLRLVMNDRQGKKHARRQGFTIDCSKPHIPEVADV